MKIKMTKKKWIVSSILGFIVLCILSFLFYSFFIVNPYDIGKREYVKGHYDKAISLTRWAIRKEINHNKDMNKIADYYTSIGLSYFGKGELEKARNYVNKALDMNKKNRNYINIFQNRINLATFDYEENKDNPDKTIEVFIDILKMSDKLQKTDKVLILISSIYKKISEIYFENKKYDKAIENSKKSLDILSKTKREYVFDILIDYNNLGSIYINEAEEEKAMHYFEKAIPLIKKYGLNENYEIVKKINSNIYTLTKILKMKTQGLEEAKNETHKTIKITRN
jgi:tetratricopeptide (TPR) repeat protein